GREEVVALDVRVRVAELPVANLELRVVAGAEQDVTVEGAGDAGLAGRLLGGRVALEERGGGLELGLELGAGLVGEPARGDALDAGDGLLDGGLDLGVREPRALAGEACALGSGRDARGVGGADEVV